MAELIAATWIAEDQEGRDAAHLLLTPLSAGHEGALQPLAAGWGLAPEGGETPPFAAVTAYVNPLMVTIEGVRLAVRRQWSSLARSRGQVVLVVGEEPRADEDAATYLAAATQVYVGLASVAATG